MRPQFYSCHSTKKPPDCLAHRLHSPPVFGIIEHKNNRRNRGHTIRPQALTRFWHRRICEAVVLVSVIVLALYFWTYLATSQSLGAGGPLVSDTAAIAAAIAAVIGIAAYFLTPVKYVFIGSLFAYGVLCVATAVLVLSTGGTSSPFLALWMLVSIFAGVFGYYGLFPLLIAINAFLVWQFIGGSLGRESLFTVVLTGELPLVVSYLIWHAKSKTSDDSDRAYNELASELSQVAGKSEVVINAIADGVIALDSQGIIQLINPAAQQIIGWGKQDALTLSYKSVLRLVDKADAELTTANDPILQAIATNKEVTTNDVSLLTNSGKKLLVSVIVSPVGQPGSGVIVVFRDITKEKAEEREQAEFISTAAHEMRTPIASIEGYLGLALNPATAQVDIRARTYINSAHESAQHLGRLFQDLLDVAKADDGRLTNNPSVVDVVAFTQNLIQGFRPKAAQKGLRLLYVPQPDDIDPNAPSVGSDRRVSPVFYANVDNDHLREIISNLIDNAIKYTPKGDVTIDITGDADHVVISVADSGIGIAQEDIPHLFQKFYRIDNSATREIGGTGLGLYLSRRLAESMNGRIWAESEFQRGSTFYVEIPRISHEDATRLIETASLAREREAANRPPVAPTAQTTPTAYPQPYTQQPTMPIPQPPQPAPTYPPYPYPPQYATPHANTPLASIERNPVGYVTTRPEGIPIPPRR